jgi:hypothetical protein
MNNQILYNQSHMENKYPCYQVMNGWSFEKSRAGFEAAIQFANENGRHVTCLASANAKPEIVWEPETKIIKLRGVNGAPITSYKQTDRP